MDYLPLARYYFDARPGLFSRVNGSETEYWLGIIFFAASGLSNLYFNGTVFGNFDQSAIIKVKVEDLAANNITEIYSLPRIYDNIVSTEWRRIKRETINGKYQWEKQFNATVATAADSVITSTLCTLGSGNNFDSLVNSSGWFLTRSDSIVKASINMGYLTSVTSRIMSYVFNTDTAINLTTVSNNARTSAPFPVLYVDRQCKAVAPRSFTPF